MFKKKSPLTNIKPAKIILDAAMNIKKHEERREQMKKEREDFENKWKLK